MNLSDLSKLILAVAIGLSCLGISIQVMRLLGALTDNIKDLRKTIKNLGILIEGFVEDQKLLTKGLKSLVEVTDKVKEMTFMISSKIIKPITVIAGFISSIAAFFEGLKSKYLKK